MPSFEIADCPTSLALTPSPGATPGLLSGTLRLTVRNITARTRTGRVLIEPDATSKPEWFSIEGATTSPRERDFDFAPQATQTINIAVAVPPGMPGGQHLLKVRVTAEQDPDNDFVESGAVAFTLPEPAAQPVAPRKKFPWWVVAVGGGVTIAIILGIALYPRGLKQPDLVGKMLADARQILVTEGYAADAIIDRAATSTTDQEPGTVVAVDYSQSSKAVLTTDPGVKVPATLKGLVQEAAERELNAVKLKVGPVKMANHQGAADNTVTEVIPAEGTPVKAGTAVALEVQETRLKLPSELDGELMLLNTRTDKCLTIAGGVSTENNVMAVQFECDLDPSRRWRLTPTTLADVYQIVNVQTKKCLATLRDEINAYLFQEDCNTDPARSWQIIKISGSRAVQIKNMRSGKCLTIAGAAGDESLANTPGGANNARALQYDCDSDQSRRWFARRPRR